MMVRNFEAIVSPKIEFPDNNRQLSRKNAGKPQTNLLKKNFCVLKFGNCISWAEKMENLRIDNLCFHGRGPYSFSLLTGQIIAVSGASGAGKSLLLRAIADLEPHQGAMTLDGENYLNFSGPEWRCRAMYLPAEAQWWKETVREHLIAEPGREELELFGFGVETLDWEISRLSSGEKQRLAILRMLQRRPQILLLDEPTASLDQQNIAKIETMLQNYVLREKAAAVWVSHDPLQIERVADRHFEILAGGELRTIR
jgi:ABC-type iron transport system FetAB ATPase subunit